MRGAGGWQGGEGNDPPHFLGDWALITPPHIYRRPGLDPGLGFSSARWPRGADVQKAAKPRIKSGATITYFLLVTFWGNFRKSPKAHNQRHCNANPDRYNCCEIHDLASFMIDLLSIMTRT